jgi:hypothetical protein
MENSSRRELSWFRYAQKELFLISKMRRSVRRKTFIGLLNTLQAEQGGLE